MGHKYLVTAMVDGMVIEESVYVSVPGPAAAESKLAELLVACGKRLDEVIQVAEVVDQIDPFARFG